MALLSMFDQTRGKVRVNKVGRESQRPGGMRAYARIKRNGGEVIA